MPLTNAQRQALYRQRKRNGNVTQRNVALHHEPGWWNGSTTKELNVATNLLHGMSGEQALVAAGASRNAATLLEKGKERLADVLKAKAVTIETVVDSTKESIEAVTPVWNPAGNESINRPDWNARAQGRRDAISLLDRAGELPATQAQAPHTQIFVNVLQFGSTPIQDVVSHADQAIDITSEVNDSAP